MLFSLTPHFIILLKCILLNSWKVESVPNQLVREIWETKGGTFTATMNNKKKQSVEQIFTRIGYYFKREKLSKEIVYEYRNTFQFYDLQVRISFASMMCHKKYP